MFDCCSLIALISRTPRRSYLTPSTCPLSFTVVSRGSILWTSSATRPKSAIPPSRQLKETGRSLPIRPRPGRNRLMLDLYRVDDEHAESWPAELRQTEVLPPEARLVLRVPFTPRLLSTRVGPGRTTWSCPSGRPIQTEL